MQIVTGGASSLRSERIQKSFCAEESSLRKTCAIAFTLITFGAVCHAQYLPRSGNAFFGYSYSRGQVVNGSAIGISMNGWEATAEGKFLPWAMRIAHNLCVDHFRKVKRTPTIKTGDDQDIFEVLNFTEESAEDKMIKKQSHNRVTDMLNRLPEDQREVIILRHYADMSFKEIAALTDCSINTALGRMRYGLINLRKMMVQKQIAL